MKNSQKACFGILDKVFPLGEEGLREVVPECFECPEKTLCLRAALESKGGIQLRRESLERSPASGFMGRLKRWSDRKELSRLMKERQKEEGK